MSFWFWMPRAGDSSLARGESALDRGEFELAAECFERALREERDPQRPRHRAARRGGAEACLELGAVRFHLGKDGDAERELERAAAFDPGFPGLGALRARIFVRSGRLGDALGSLEHALRADPRDQESLLLLVVVRDLAGSREGALRILERAAPGVGDASGPEAALLAAPQSPATRVRGRAGAVAALAPLAAAVRERPDWVDRRLRLAHALLAQDRFADAARELDRALALSPRYLTARVLRVRLALATGDAGEAAHLLGPALEGHPEFPDLHYWLGRARLRIAGSRAARESLERAVELNRQFARAHRMLALLHHREGRGREALRSLRRAFLRDREPPRRHDRRRVRLDADARLHRAIARRPGYPDLHLQRARLERERGRLDEARLSCATALRLQGGFDAAWMESARIDLESGAVVGALPVLERLAREHPGWADAHALLGRARGKIGDLAGAESAFRQALLVNPRYREARGELDETLAGSNGGNGGAAASERERGARNGGTRGPARN